VILDLPRFIAAEQPYWNELDGLLKRLDQNPYLRMNVQEVARLDYLYHRSVSALGRMATFSADTQAREYLEAVVARGYANCHPSPARAGKFRPVHWLFATFPQTFRRHWRAFALALALTIAGTTFGAAAISFDHDAKAVLMPFSQLLQTPAERVKHEEAEKNDRLAGAKSTFSAQLMTHNIQVALITFAMGATWGVGSTVLLFYNGVTLGAVAADYAQAGYGEFLLGWLLPHGVIEIPAILVAGQAGFVLASALIGWGNRFGRRKRLRIVSGDVLTLASGAAVMLVWAGIVEAFFSQYHYPVLPYSLKIAFGMVEACLLTAFLWRMGRT
jgi:uncharacterized membrane protein SpoIIM required for sporulation